MFEVHVALGVLHCMIILFAEIVFIEIGFINCEEKNNFFIFIN